MLVELTLFVISYLVIRRLLRSGRCDCQCDETELSNTTMLTIDHVQQTHRRETNEAISIIARHLKTNLIAISDASDMTVSRFEAAFALQALSFVAELQATNNRIEAEVDSRNHACYVSAKFIHNKDNKLFNQSRFMNRQEIAKMRQWFIAESPKFTQQLFNWFAHHYAHERYEGGATYMRARGTWTQPSNFQSSPAVLTSGAVLPVSGTWPYHTGKSADWNTNWMWYYHTGTSYQPSEVKQNGWDMFMLDDGTPLLKELTKEAAESLFDAAFPKGLMLDDPGIALPIISVHTEPDPSSPGYVIAKVNQGFYVKHATVLMAHVIQHLYSLN